jgi:hypothetical protein
MIGQSRGGFSYKKCIPSESYENPPPRNFGKVDEGVSFKPEFPSVLTWDVYSLWLESKCPSVLQGVIGEIRVGTWEVEIRFKARSTWCHKREKERDRERDRQTDRQTDRDRQIDRQNHHSPRELWFFSQNQGKEQSTLPRISQFLFVLFWSFLSLKFCRLNLKFNFWRSSPLFAFKPSSVSTWAHRIILPPRNRHLPYWSQI